MSPPPPDASVDGELAGLDTEVLECLAALFEGAEHVLTLCTPAPPPDPTEIAAAVERMPGPSPEVAEILRQHADDHSRADPAEWEAEFHRMGSEALATISNFSKNEARRARSILALRAAQRRPVGGTGRRTGARARAHRARRTRTRTRARAPDDSSDEPEPPEGRHVDTRARP
jgi:hypothetical protein